MALGAGMLAAFRSRAMPAARAQVGSGASSIAKESKPSSTPRRSSSSSVQIPTFFLCPISYEIMADPVTLDTGMTYDRASIEEWLESGHNTCPSTNRTLLSHELIPNLTLQRAIRTWCAANRSSGNGEEASRLLDALAASADAAAFYANAKDLYTVAEESGRTRRSLREGGAIGRLSTALVELKISLAREKKSRNWLKGLEYAVATIAMLHPSGEEDKRRLAVPVMVTILAELLAIGSTTAKINSAKVLMSVLSGEDCDHETGRLKTQIGNQWGAIKGVLSLIRDDELEAKETRLGLRLLLALLSPTWNRVVAINERAVHSLVELLPRGENRAQEYAYAILEVLANCAEGREAITNHPFAIPRIVEYLHGVSIPATESAVGTLHCVISLASNRTVVTTALRAGAFTTLLMLLPSECSPKCKTKAREALKLLNHKYASRPGDDNFSVFIERGLGRLQQQQQD